jgi:predicted CXXCH cytochrome family protein
MRIRHTIIAVLLLLAPVATVSQTRTGAVVDGCVTCHAALDDELKAPVGLSHDDIHARAGISCAGCHGGDASSDDAETAMSEAAGFTGSPAAAEVPAFCGRCHSDAAMMKRFDPSMRVDQQTEYATSTHGRRLATGDVNVATCISCHGTHGILSVDDANAPVHPMNVAKTCGACHANAATMAPYGLATDQAAKYATSVHWKTMVTKQDLSAPTCNDCHGNHGAAPPGIASVAHVCGTCHARQEELFQKSAHRVPFEEASIAGCVACHGNHAVASPHDEMLGSRSGSACTQCHSEGDAAIAFGERSRLGFLSLSRDIDSASHLLARAANVGMEVSRPTFELKEASDKLINARVVIHSLSAHDVDSLVTSGATTAVKARNAGIAALEENDNRRLGLAGSLVVIIGAALAIYLKVRQIERRRGALAMSNGE